MGKWVLKVKHFNLYVPEMWTPLGLEQWPGFQRRRAAALSMNVLQN